MTALRLWRVGHVNNPLGFPSREFAGWNHRFDDPARDFRTIYCAESPDTAVREAVADFRPNPAARSAFIEAFGDSAVDELPVWHVTAAWRRRHVLTEVHADLTGPVTDLLDPRVRTEIEITCASLLNRHGLKHLDHHEITTRQREVTQAVAGKLFRETKTAGIRFPSRLDGQPALALFEGRARLRAGARAAPMTDPPPPALERVCAEWGLIREPA